MDNSRTQQTIEAYENIARQYVEKWFESSVMEPMLSRFLQYMGNFSMVLDVGCGPGRDTLSMSNKKADVVGVDLSTAMLVQARKKAPDCQFRRMDMRKLLYPPATFDGIWASASLHHLSINDAIHTINEFKKVLKPLGILAVTVEQGEGENLDEVGRYRYLYTANVFVSMLEDIGFTIIEQSVESSEKPTLGTKRKKKWIHVIARAEHESQGLLSCLGPSNCFFCSPSRFKKNLSIGLPGVGSILWGDEDLTVMLDIAPLSEGHVLIVTTPHSTCFGACLESVDKKLYQTQQQVCELLDSAFGCKTLFFEHGPAYPAEAGSCIDHAHWHGIPLNGCMPPEIDKILHEGRKGNMNSLRQLHRAEKSYLYLEKHPERKTVHPVNDSLPSQYLRQLLVDRQNPKHWQWQLMCEQIETQEVFKSTLSRFYPLLDRRYDMELV